MRPVNLATPMLDSLHGGTVYPGGITSPDADANIREVLPQPIKSLALVDGKMTVAGGILGLSQSLRPGSEKCFRLLDVGSHGVGLRLDLSNRPIITSLKEIEAKPVDLTN